MTKAKSNVPAEASATQDKKDVQAVEKKSPSQLERFTAEVMKQFTNNAGDLQLTNFQKKLCQNYFIKIDQMLKDAEKKRLAKSEQYRDKLEFAWKNVNMQKLAIDVVSFSAIGLDPMQPNHINCIPYKNTVSNLFDIAFMEGYKGKEVKARKYGLDIPDDVIVELVYKNDKFRPIKRDLNNKIETYEFQITDPFNRGELVGGFYCHVFKDHPEKNRLRSFSKADIEKRIPEHASPEFWGGEKDEWKEVEGRRQKVGKIKVDGWYDEMAYKTIFRAAYNAITIDSQKIDDHYVAVLSKEKEQRDDKVLQEIKINANKLEAIGFDEPEQAKPAALNPQSETEAPQHEEPEVVEMGEEALDEQQGQATLNGPGW